MFETVGEGREITSSSAILSTVTESLVTSTAIFLVVPASRRECASTRAPEKGSN